MRAKCCAEVRDLCSALPQFLRHCSDLTPEVVIMLQVDEQDCFMRLFITIPRFAEVFSKLCLPILHLDGAHSKSTLCDSVLILIVAKLGNGAQLHLGLAHVPVESSLHMVWIVLLLRLRGSDVESIPIFSDRGNLLAASRILLNDHGLTLSTKFCLEHLIRNVVSKFSMSKGDTGSLRAIMVSMQSSATIDVFVTETHRLMAMLDCTLGGRIAACLLRIHPIHWTVFGNRDSQLEEVWVPKFKQLLVSSLFASGEVTIEDNIDFMIATHLDSTVPKGRKFPLCCTCRNNNAEGAACGLLSAGIRHSAPAAGLVQFLGCASTQLLSCNHECMSADPEVHQFTPIGSQWHMDAANRTNIGLDLT
jgi:hypothetical protein